MAFGAEMEMRMYIGEDEGVIEEVEHSPGAIVVETLLNMRTVASLTMERTRVIEFDDALVAEDPTPLRTSVVKGSAMGLGQFSQFWGCKC
jgi:ATP-binding cassette subfamily B (MDR/TAP) protein 1